MDVFFRINMIHLFNINNHKINTNSFSNLLHDKIVQEFESVILDYVGAKYAVTFNSATSAIFLSLLGKNTTITIPSIIPPVVLNAILTSGNKYKFSDNIEWVGDSYILHEFNDYKIIDSAQKIERNQFINECNDNDLMIFSFYPTKPIGSCDGGMIVSNDFDKIKYLKELSLNGMSYSKNNWERKINFPGYKMYMNSIQADIALRNFHSLPEKYNRLKHVRDVYNETLGYGNTSNHLYRIEVSDRDNFISYMKTNNIICGIHYDALHLHPVYELSDSNYPESTRVSKTTISIPFHEKLNDSDINYIIDKIHMYDK